MSAWTRVGGTVALLVLTMVGFTVAAVVGGMLELSLIAVTGLGWVLVLPFMLGFMAWMGLPLIPGPRGWFAGAGAGAAVLLVPAVLARALGGYTSLETSGQPTGGSALPAIVPVALALVIAAAGEEVLFRWALVRLWRPALGAAGAVALTAALFMGVHVANPGASVAGGVGVAIAGLLLGAVYVRTGSFWVVAGAHFGWNAAEALILGVPVSGIRLPALLRWEASTEGSWGRLLGGDFGPEEGLLFHGALALALLVVVLWGQFSRTSDGSDSPA